MTAFASMILDGLAADRGVLAPEACVDPGEFGACMSRLMPRYEGGMSIEEIEL